MVRQEGRRQIVVHQTALGWFVVLDRRQHHRPEGRLRRRVSGHQRLFTYPASTGNVTPVT